MSDKLKLEANRVALAYCWESADATFIGTPTVKVIPGAANIFHPVDPNTIADSGSEITTVARNPISPDRRRRKGSVTDLTASAGFQQDLVCNGLRDLFQGFLFAALRSKYSFTGVAIAVDSGAKKYTAAAIAPAALKVNDLVYITGMGVAGNNGLKSVVTVDAGNGYFTVTETCYTEAVSPTTAKVVICGHKFRAGDGTDMSCTVTGGTTTLVTATKDCTELQLIPGEFIYVGGDTAGDRFSGAGVATNRGFARVKSVAAHAIILDKTEATFTADATTDAVQVFFANQLLKDESGALVLPRTLTVEEDMGFLDVAGSTDRQALYILGCMPETLTITVPTSNKITVDMAFTAMDSENWGGTGSLKPAASRSALVAEEAFNTTSGIPRIKLAVFSATATAPVPLWAYVTDLALSVKNNSSLDRALGVLGAFDGQAGSFDVSGSLTAYLCDIHAVDAIRNSDDVTLDLHLVQTVGGVQQGISIDLPLLQLAGGKVGVAKDKAVMLAIKHDCVSGATIDANQSHTIAMFFWDYLPALA
jgi:hypothetical protein